MFLDLLVECFYVDILLVQVVDVVKVKFFDIWVVFYLKLVFVEVFYEIIDKVVLDECDEDMGDQLLRDCLFDIFMIWIDVMVVYKDVVCLFVEVVERDLGFFFEFNWFVVCF